jgi:Fe-S cluster assembly protein SufD
MAFEERIDVHAELHDVRTAAKKNFENKGFPTKKEEAWKYTSLNTILKMILLFSQDNNINILM